MRTALILICVACGPAIREARLSHVEPPSERELDAARRVAASPCPDWIDVVFPGVAQACFGKPVDAAILASLGAGELGAGIAVAASEPKASSTPARRFRSSRSRTPGSTRSPMPTSTLLGRIGCGTCPRTRWASW